MILVLDTDHLTAIQRQAEPAYSNLHAKLRAAPSAEVCATIVSFEEQMRGWLSLISKAKGQRQVLAYAKLGQQIPYPHSVDTRAPSHRSAKLLQLPFLPGGSCRQQFGHGKASLPSRNRTLAICKAARAPNTALR